MSSEKADAAVAPRRGPLDWGGFIVVVVCAAFVLIWWNRYQAPTSGYELYLVSEFHRGHLPYRDHYYALPPGYIFRTVGIAYVLGDRLIGFLAAGALLRIVAAWCVYRWLIKIGPRPVAALAVITSVFVGCNSSYDYAASYVWDSFAFGTLAAFCASKTLETRGWACAAWGLVSGLILGATCVEKQTTGVIGTGAVLVATLYATWLMFGARRALSVLALLGAGAAVPMGLAVYWLRYNHLWNEFIDQVWVRGPASKGGLFASLARPFVDSLRFPDRCGGLLLALTLLSLGVALVGYTLPRRPDGRRAMLATAFLGLAAVFGFLLIQFRLQGFFFALYSRTPLLAAVYCAGIGSFAAALAALWTSLRGSRELAVMHLGILAGTAFALGFAMSMSGVATPASAFPSLAVALVFAFNLTSGPVLRRRLHPALVSACLVLVAIAGARKVLIPCTWGFWIEPALTESNTRPKHPKLAGLTLSAETAGFFDQVSEAISAHSGPDEPILVFPHMPMLYGLTDRTFSTFCYMHWQDVCPDYVAEQDADRIRKDPPAVIAFMDIPVEFYRMQEVSFRDGRPSGLRRMLETIQELAPQYEEVYTYSGQPFPVRVWARQRAPAPSPAPPQH